MYRIYLGHVPLADAYRAGRIELAGSSASVRKFIDAFQPSPVASIVRTESPGQRADPRRPPSNSAGMRAPIVTPRGGEDY